ncbi:MAG: hypothetical protein JO356_18055, partial [Acidobacteria bacterium]|nr:hypothetical protein [Acidobacteriota bacterium]
MGLGIVLLFWAVLGVVVASIGALTLAGTVTLLTRQVRATRRRVILSAALFPFVCLGWGACVFVFQAVVNELLLDRDLGIGDTWHAPLRNRYQIMMIDVTDQGWVYNPKTQPASGVREQQDAVVGVRKLQVAGRYILGGADSKSFENLGRDSQNVDWFFILDSDTGKQTKFQTYDALRSGAQELRITLNLEPMYRVYSRFRFTWFDMFAALLF